MRTEAVAWCAAFLLGMTAWAADGSFVIAEKGVSAECVIVLPAEPTPSQKCVGSAWGQTLRRQIIQKLA